MRYRRCAGLYNTYVSYLFRCICMPKTERGRPPKRTSVGLPNPMIDEIDRIVAGHPEMNYTRQQFIESAVREKIERIRLLERPGRA